MIYMKFTYGVQDAKTEAIEEVEVPLKECKETIKFLKDKGYDLSKFGPEHNFLMLLTKEGLCVLRHGGVWLPVARQSFPSNRPLLDPGWPWAFKTG